MVHNYNKSSDYERLQTTKADSFYSTVLHATEIKRYNTNSKEDLVFQYRDIDVSIKTPKGIFDISEKFRKGSYEDMLIEVYSKYPDKKGWMHTGSPDLISYFLRDKVYLISHNTLKEFCFNELFTAVPEEWYLEIFNSQVTYRKKEIKLKGRKVPVSLIQAHNNTNGSCWETISLAIDFDALEKHGVKLMKFAI